MLYHVTIEYNSRKNPIPHTFSQIYIHLVFAVEHRQALISDSFRQELHKYITGIVQNKHNKMFAVNSMDDHIHILLGLNPDLAISELVKTIKHATGSFINGNLLTEVKFNWQTGYGAFSYSKSQLPDVIRYIKNQQHHHRKESFRQEYIKILENFGISYQDCYLFRWPGE